MKRKSGECNICGLEKLIYAKGKCNYCYWNEKNKAKLIDKANDTPELEQSIGSAKKPRHTPQKQSWNHSFYMKWWNKTKNACVECGIGLGYYNPRHIHHLILKSKQKNYSVDITENEENIVKVCSRCHDQAHYNLDKAPVIKAKTEEVLEKYEQLKQYPQT